MADAASEAPVQVRAGRLHIPSEVYQRLLHGCPALALLEREGHWVLLPLLAGAGGLQIKIRNARGDRVVEAQEFFRSQGFDDQHAPCDVDLVPAPELGGFRLVVNRPIVR